MNKLKQRTEKTKTHIVLCWQFLSKSFNLSLILKRILSRWSGSMSSCNCWLFFLFPKQKHVTTVVFNISNLQIKPVNGVEFWSHFIVPVKRRRGCKSDISSYRETPEAPSICVAPSWLVPPTVHNHRAGGYVGHASPITYSCVVCDACRPSASLCL